MCVGRVAMINPSRGVTGSVPQTPSLAPTPVSRLIAPTPVSRLRVAAQVWLPQRLTPLQSWSLPH